MAPITKYAQMPTLRKMAIAGNLEQLNAFPCLASIDDWSIYILSNYVSSFDAMDKFHVVGFWAEN